ncbi:MAG: beta-lactamase family protein [Flavobacterium sp.]|nr:beta-lactamase family protein [Flavobacterium sp.]
MKFSINLVLVCLLVVSSGLAQPRDSKTLDNYFDALETNNKFMGNIVISHEGKTIYQRSVGYSDKLADVKLSAKSKFRIGSISKTFTSALTFKAIEENKIKLSDLLSKFYPSVPNSEKITIEMLLSHRSGIHNFTDNDDYESWSTSPKTPSEMVEIITAGGSDFEPDSKADYSNANYVLLSYILQDVYKKPYAQLLKEKITQPLKLSDTYYGGDLNTSTGEAHSYKFNGEWQQQNPTHMSIPSGAGAIVSTMDDLATFIEALFAGKIVSAQSLDKMKTIRDDYGMGLFRFPFNDKTGYGHTGGIDAFASFLAYFPQDKVTIAFSSNGSNIKNNDVALAALLWFYNMPVTVPEFASYNYKDGELEKYTGIYTSTQMPLKITISAQGTTLMAQATGQSAFALDATSLHKFQFDRAGVVLEFSPDTNEMVLKQGGGVYEFTKE